VLVRLCDQIRILPSSTDLAYPSGLVGKEVLRQLSSPSLSKIFSFIGLANSKRLILLPSGSTHDANTLISLISTPDPSKLRQIHEPFDAYILLQSIQSIASESTDQILLIDCTSDLRISSFYPKFLASSISVVTPNKKGFSSSVGLFNSIAISEPGLIGFESTVGAGLPIISTLRELIKTGDQVEKIEGVFSGTLSFIFNEWSRPGAGEGGKSFSEIVREAKEKGYTVSAQIFFFPKIS
jgi:homoserine dehydrogenase